MISPISLDTSDSARAAQYREVRVELEHLLAGDCDWVAAMATVASELHHAFDYFSWTGFYRRVSPSLLLVGPYQGAHGCIYIPLTRGVCGAAARTNSTQLIDDVTKVSDHIACSADTRSEIVVPVCDGDGDVFAVLDIDAFDLAAFRQVDREALESLCADLGRRFAPPKSEPHDAEPGPASPRPT